MFTARRTKVPIRVRASGHQIRYHSFNLLSSCSQLSHIPSTRSPRLSTTLVRSFFVVQTTSTLLIRQRNLLFLFIPFLLPFLCLLSSRPERPERTKSNAERPGRRIELRLLKLKSTRTGDEKKAKVEIHSAIDFLAYDYLLQTTARRLDCPYTSINLIDSFHARITSSLGSVAVAISHIGSIVNFHIPAISISPFPTTQSSMQKR